MRLFLCTVILSFAAITMIGSDYLPVKGKMITRWGKEITPENVWREYPRPQLKRDLWQNLNGLWDYAIIAKETGKPSVFEGKILVPFAVESALSGVGRKVLPSEKVWYRKTFEIPKEWKGQQIKLHFEAVDWETAVWVNGKLAGTHRGGKTPFVFDITRYLKQGHQELVVSVWDPTDTGSQPRGKQVLDPKGIWYTAVTGIWQTVWLEPVNSTSVEWVYPVSDIDREQLLLHVELSGAKGGEELRIRVWDEDKQIVEKSELFSACKKIVLDIPSPKLWSPNTPKLYGLEILLYRDNKLLDHVDSYFAMRKISIGRNEQGFQQIRLNNEPIFQYGTLDQGWWPDGLLTPPSEDAMRYDMEVLKSMGFTMLRKHIKVEPSRYYYYADSLGLLVWQDIVSGFESAKAGQQHVKWGAPNDWDRPKESAMQFEYEMKEEMDHLKFFPSIVTWVIFNERWGQYDTKRIVEWAMSHDPTRLVDGASGWVDRGCGHMVDAHQYPGPGMVSAELNPERATVLGEFGGLGLPVQGHLWNPEMRNWGYRTYTSVPELMTEYALLIHNLSLLRHRGLCAAVYTQTTDVEGEVNGLMTYDREIIKMDPRFLRMIHSPLYSSKRLKIKKLLPESETHPQEILISEIYPGKNWLNGEGAFIKTVAPFNVAKNRQVWSMRSFLIEEIPSYISLRMLAYGIVKVYLNGKTVLDKKVISKRHYEDFNLSEFVGLLRKGENVIAIETGKFEANSPFDYGLYAYTD